jgi:hypothetical protein
MSQIPLATEPGQAASLAIVTEVQEEDSDNEYAFVSGCTGCSTCGGSRGAWDQAAETLGVMGIHDLAAQRQNQKADPINPPKRIVDVGGKPMDPRASRLHVQQLLTYDADETGEISRNESDVPEFRVQYDDSTDGSHRKARKEGVDFPNSTSYIPTKLHGSPEFINRLQEI